MIRAADEIIEANQDIEKEINDILSFDDTIRHSLEIRDRKLSPVLQ